MRKVTHNKIANATAETIVKEWYHKAYPSDPEWESLKEFTFYDVFYLLDNYYSPDFGDSIIRERVFKELSFVMDADYNYIYDQWIMAKETVNMTNYDIKYNNEVELEDILGKGDLTEGIHSTYQESKNAYNNDLSAMVDTLDELFLDDELTKKDLMKLKSGRGNRYLVAKLVKITFDRKGVIINTDLAFNDKDDEVYFNRVVQNAAKVCLDMNGIVNESWTQNATEEDIERFRNRYSELKNDTKRGHKWLEYPRSAEDVIADGVDAVADDVWDFIESHKQYFAPDSGIFNRGYFYIEKKFNRGMGRTRLCKINPKTKTIYLTNVANRFDIKYLEESFPKYKIERDEKYSPWDRKSW